MAANRKYMSIARRAGALLTAMAACLVHLAAVPAGARAATPALAGVTRITGTTTSVSWVDVPTEARLKIQQGANPDIVIEGGGRMAGVVLSQGDASDLSRPFLMAARASFCDSAVCAPEDSNQFLIAEMTTQGSDWVVLKPGRYLLYLITDGAPVSVTLRLHGLSGKAKLVPATPVEAEFGAPTAESQVMAPGKTAYWFGGSGTIQADGGLVAGIMNIEATQWLQGVYGSCLQREVLSPEPVVYSPLCPGGTAARTSDGGVSPSPVAREIFETSIWNVTPGGDWGLGMHYLALAEVQNVAAVTLYLPYQLPRG